MSRRARANTPFPLLLLAGTIVLSAVLGAAVLGPDRAFRIASAASAGQLVDGLAQGPFVHHLQVMEIEVAPTALDSLEADLPWSGGQRVNAVVHHKGIAYKARFRYRGVYATTHYLGGKRSFRLDLKRDNPFSPYRTLDIINPKSFNMLNDHLALWLSGRLGVAVPYDDLVFVRLNGRDLGVMEMIEKVGPDLERNRHLVDHKVAVFKGDHPPVTERALPSVRALWRDAGHWEFQGGRRDSALAHQRLSALTDLIADTTLGAVQWTDSAGTLIDLEAYARYFAAIRLINTAHIDNYHNQWLVLSPRDHRLYPVMWDPLLMFPPEGEPLYPVHDALSFHLLADARFRRQRDRLLWQALNDLRTTDAFGAHVDLMVERMLPSLLADRNKFGVVSAAPEDVHRFSLLHWQHSLEHLTTACTEHWRRLSDSLATSTATVRPGQGGYVLSGGTSALVMELDAGAVPVLEGDAVLVPLMEDDPEGRSRWLVAPEVRPAGGRGRRQGVFTDGQHYVVRPIQARIILPGGGPATFRNAVTDAQIDTQ